MVIFHAPPQWIVVATFGPTVAALVNEINRRDAKHIITIEDPIEYEHTNQMSVIQQVEIHLVRPSVESQIARVVLVMKL